MTDRPAAASRGAHAADEPGDEDSSLSFLPALGIVVVVGAGLAISARTSALALLIAIAVLQALLGAGWVIGTALPGRNGAVVIGAAAAAGSDIAVSVWPHSRLGTLLVVFALAVPVMFVHQLARGAARVRVVESLSSVAMLVAIESSPAAFLQLRHEFAPTATAGRVVAAVLAAAGGALVVGYLVDMIMPAPRFDAGVHRGLLAVVAAAGLGGSVGHLAITDGAAFIGTRGTFAGAALGALVGFFAVAVAFLDVSLPGPTSGAAERTRALATALVPLSLAGPVSFLLLLAIRA